MIANFISPNNTKQNIIDAFWSLYRTKRIETISVREIMQKAGYNRSTFYEYFTDVYNLLAAIEDNLIKEGEDGFTYGPPSIEFRNFIKGNGKRNEAMDDWTNRYVLLYQKYEEYLPVLLGENGDPAFLKKLKISLKRTIYNHPFIQKIQNSFELELVLEYSISAITGVLTYWYTLKERPPVELLLKTVFDLNHGTRLKVLNMLKEEYKNEKNKS